MVNSLLFPFTDTAFLLGTPTRLVWASSADLGDMLFGLNLLLLD